MRKWVKRWKVWVEAGKPVVPGVYRRRDGGFVIRGRAVNRKSGKKVDICQSLPDERDPRRAAAFLEIEKQRVRDGAQHHDDAAPPPEMPTWRNYALSLFKRKVADGSIASAKGKEKWSTILAHLAKAHFAGYLLDRIEPRDTRAWRNALPSLTWTRKRKDAKGKPYVEERPYHLSTLNDWLAVARVISAAAKKDHELPRDPMADVEDFDTTREEPTYSEEEPNALTPEEFGGWLEKFKELYPQHFAMVLLGFATGQRPSTLRPLRLRGAKPDINLETRVLLLRRSHTLRQEVMPSTKTGVDQKITLPESVVEVVRWHVRTQRIETREQRESELLFPTEAGGLRSKSCLQKPFERVTEACKLKKTITPRAMRRTFNDLAREAAIDGVVMRAVSGHQTEEMRYRYSSARQNEIEAAVAKVVNLADRREARSGGASGGATSPEPRKRPSRTASEGR